MLLRTTEFLWQEEHTCHATEAQAREVLTDVYGAFMTEVLAIPVLRGYKIAWERFAGASNTLTCEAMMSDGKAVLVRHVPGTKKPVALTALVP